MGYILPMQPTQTGLYAGRSNIESYDYANVQRVHPVKMKSLFEEELEQKLQEPDLPLGNGFRKPTFERPVSPQIQQAALSQEISLVVGKGLQINTYV